MVSRNKLPPDTAGPETVGGFLSTIRLHRSWNSRRRSLFYSTVTLLKSSFSFLLFWRKSKSFTPA